MFRLGRVPVDRARVDGKEQVKGFRGLSLVVRQRGVELSHFVPGNLMLVPDWYRNVEDVAMDNIGRPGADALRLTFRSGDRFDEVWLTPSADDRTSAWNALAAVGVKTESGSTSLG